MKKFDIPVMEVAKFDTENVVTGSGFETSATKDAAVQQLDGKISSGTEILTFTF
jgi:hypothetical protein